MTHAKARTARGEIEQALGALGWPWRSHLSRWLDALGVLEEAAAEMPEGRP